jgi:hypothetical protein
MVSATGNAIRDKVLYAAIRKLTVPSFESAVAALPADFDLDDIEYSGAVKILELYGAPDDPEPPPLVRSYDHGSAPRALLIDKNPDGHSLVSSKSLEKIEAPRAPQPEPPPIATAKATPEPVRMTAIEANHAIIAAQHRLGEARIVLQHKRDATAKARAALANAVTIWQTGLPPYSQEQLIRDHLRSEQEKRRQRIEGGAPPQAKTHGHSAIDIAAAYSKDNSPEGAVRSRMQYGRSRGAFDKSKQYTQNYDPRRGPVFKPPSER